MKTQRITDDLKNMLALSVKLAGVNEAEAILLLLEAPMDWEKLKTSIGKTKLLAAADTPEQLKGASEADIDTVFLEMTGSPVYEKLTQAILEAVADDLLEPGAEVVALYSGFEQGRMDSVSVIHLDEHLQRLTVRDLRQLETRVPLDTLKLVVDLAVEIGREGREGHPVGTMFIVGDAKSVLKLSNASGFDPVKGYHRKERSLNDKRVREGIKEIAQMDGAFVISGDGTVEACSRVVNAAAKGITLSKGLGARHWAAAAISRATNAIAVSVSQSNGTVRVFQNGDVVLRIEPFRRPMKWMEFEFEPPMSDS